MKKTIACVCVGAAIFFSFFAGSVVAADNPGVDRNSAVVSVSRFLQDTEAPVDYTEVSRAILLLGPGSEGLLVQVLKREKAVKVTEGVRLPGVMSPLDMLKATALDALGELRAYQCINEMKEVYHKTGNGTLRRIAKKNIEALGGSADE